MTKNEETDLARMATTGNSTDSRTAATDAPSAHTPTPWYWTGDGRIIEGEGYIIADPEGGIVNDEDVEFIVRACNSHYDLLAALKDVMEVLRVEAPGTPLNHHKYDALGIRAHAAIRKAEGT